MTNIEIRDHFKRKPRPALLRRLARYLETKVPEKKFDMDNFCGTARCAFGHAPSLPDIGKQLKVARLQDGVYRYPDLRLKPASAEKALKEFVNIDAYRNKFGVELLAPDNFARAAYIFGITYDEAEQVFGFSSGDFSDRQNNSLASVALGIRLLAISYDGKPVEANR